jgi:hypothetical protein
MPAYRERVYLCPERTGQPVWVGPMPEWWDRRAFFAKFGERSVDTGNPIYADYVLILTQWEASAWDQECRERFPANRLSGQEVTGAEMEAWQAQRRAARWVIVESYEWESGLE